MTLLKVSLPVGAKVLLLEDSDMRINWFAQRVPEADLTVAKTVDELRDHFQNHRPADFIFYDHDLGTTETGLDAAKYMANKFGSKGSRWALIHSWNADGARAMQQFLTNTPHVPFGEFEIEFV